MSVIGGRTMTEAHTVAWGTAVHGDAGPRRCQVEWKSDTQSRRCCHFYVLLMPIGGIGQRVPPGGAVLEGRSAAGHCPGGGSRALTRWDGSALPCESLSVASSFSALQRFREAHLVPWPLPLTVGQPPSFTIQGPGASWSGPRSLLPAGWGVGRVPSPLLVDKGAGWLLWLPVSCCAHWFQGYEGLVEGGENIKPANWLSVSNIIQLVRPAVSPFRL